MAVGTAVAIAQAVRPARIIRPGRSAPTKGSRAMRMRRWPALLTIQRHPGLRTRQCLSVGLA